MQILRQLEWIKAIWGRANGVEGCVDVRPLR